MYQLAFRLIALGVLTGLVSCHPAKPPHPSPDDALVKLARGPLHLEVPADVEVKSEANLTGFRSGEVLFSRRKDSRTYFVHDQRYGATRPGGTFGGSDDQLVRRAREMVVALGLPPSEIDRTSVLQENSRVGHRDPATKKIVLEPTQSGGRSVLVTRRIVGIPVFSSRALVGLTRKGSAGFLELHWPEIPPGAIEEGRRLQELVNSAWRPPALEGARVESVEAGIIHSPAIGFVMDVYPVIRIVYAPTDGKLGRKPVTYVDASGKTVPVPRQFEHGPRPPEKTVRAHPRQRAGTRGLGP
jgi:hypothetical protein